MRRCSSAVPPRRKYAGGLRSSVEPRVEEDRQLELLRNAIGEGDGGLPGSRLVLRLERDERHDVGRAGPRMHAFVPGEIDPLRRDADAREQGFDELVAVTGERVDGAVVIVVDMDVEKPSRRRQRSPQCRDRFPISGGREVRDGLERERHGRLV